MHLFWMCQSTVNVSFPACETSVQGFAKLSRSRMGIELQVGDFSFGTIIGIIRSQWIKIFHQPGNPETTKLFHAITWTRSFTKAYEPHMKPIEILSNERWRLDQHALEVPALRWGAAGH